MLSMTAFARCTDKGDWGSATWECRSINHRYLEPFFKLPDNLRVIEPECRRKLQALKRGKIECFLSFTPSDSSRLYPSLDLKRLEVLVQQINTVKNQIGSFARVDLASLLARHDLWQTPPAEVFEACEPILLLFDRTLTELISQRTREGYALKCLIGERMDAMVKVIDKVKEHLPSLLEEQHMRMFGRLDALKSGCDPDRLEQELVFYAHKLDVNEELDRLDLHIKEVKRILAQEEGPVGKRLDFLMQELQREANTLGAKISDVTITKAAVDLKVLIEQAREQIQNVV